MKVTVYLQVEYLKNGAFRVKVTKEHCQDFEPNRVLERFWAAVFLQVTKYVANHLCTTGQ